MAVVQQGMGRTEIELLITVGGESAATDAHALVASVARDPDVQGRCDFDIGGPSRPGEMGGAFEIINAVITHGVAVAALFTAIGSWRVQRAQARAAERPPTVTVDYRGARVTIHNGSPDDVRRIFDVLGLPAGEEAS